MTNKKNAGSWQRMSFKGNKVWAQTDENNNLLIDNGKVLIKYNLKQDYEYRVHLNSLKPEDQAVPAQKKSPPSKKQAGSLSGKKNNAGNSTAPLKPVKSTEATDIPESCIRIYTDGASSGNPGPAGIGVLLLYGEKQKKISEYIGIGTNNIAELTAIKTALKELKRYDLPVRIFSDSSYSIGLLTKGWKAKKNQELVAEIKELMTKFSDLAFIKVKGHAGIKENEVADFLATSAIKKGLV